MSLEQSPESNSTIPEIPSIDETALPSRRHPALPEEISREVDEVSRTMHPSLLRIARAVLTKTASSVYLPEDVMSEVYMTRLKSGFIYPKKNWKYVYPQTVRNTAITLGRRILARPSVPIDPTSIPPEFWKGRDTQTPSADPEAIIMGSETISMLGEAVSEYRRRSYKPDSEIFTMVDILLDQPGITIKELGKEFPHKTVGSLRVMKHRAREILQELIRSNPAIFG